MTGFKPINDVPPDLQPLLSRLLDTARDILATQGYLEPVAFIGSKQPDGKPHFTAMAMDLSDEEVKETTALAIRTLCAVSGADWVFTIGEVWKREGKTLSDAKEASPSEAVALTLQTKAGSWLATGEFGLLSGQRRLWPEKFEWSYSIEPPEGTLSN